ncbi:MAG: YbaB/EbfC family nucleoid-associated protein [Clostridiales bacterium]|jgi:DNA-binding YbaB/EbfC family protein|nr:YbaB/EbfC family nucleoid-associated protein [Clostridiales bacterium]
MAKGGHPNMGGMNMQQMMKQAQKMQQDMLAMQETLGAKELTAQAGGGVVKATVYGRKELKSIEIDPCCVDPDDVEMLQDLITAAVNEAMRMADELMSAEMGKVTGGLNLGL